MNCCMGIYTRDMGPCSVQLAMGCASQVDDEIPSVSLPESRGEVPPVRAATADT